MSFWLWWLLYFTPKPETSPWFRVSAKTLIALGDTQLITALAITITSLLFITVEKDTSLYHIFVARGLVDVNMAGYGASLIMGTMDQCNFMFRWALLVALVVIYLVWNEFCIQKFEGWSHKPPLCFQNENIVPGDYTTWMHLNRIWCPLGFIWVLLEPFEPLQRALQLVENDLAGQPMRYWGDLFDTWRSRPSATPKAFYLAMAGYAGGPLLSVIAVILAAITITPPFFTPFAGLLFVSWAVYNVYMVRRVNGSIWAIVTCPSDPTLWERCKENPEPQLGFGQILPFCLILSTVLQLADIYSGTSAHP